MIKLRPVQLVIAAVWLAAAMMAAAVIRQPHPPKSSVVWTPGANSPTPPVATRKISQQELEASDGKDGHKCYVAVDRIVYVIPVSIDWKNGQHIPSNGLVYCGKDVSAEITKSPHGAGVLKSLEIAGTL